MKMFTALLFTLFVVAFAANAQSDIAAIKTKFLGSYWKHGKVDGELWHNVLVPPNIAKEDLIAVAKALFADRPGYYRFFTDDKEFQAFILSDLHYLQTDKPNYPYPEKWANKHYLAMINKRNYLGEWALWAQSAAGLKFAGDDSVIAILGKPDKPIK